MLWGVDINHVCKETLRVLKWTIEHRDVEQGLFVVWVWTGFSFAVWIEQGLSFELGIENGLSFKLRIEQGLTFDVGIE